MRVATVFFIVLTSASTVTFAAPLPASISTRPSAPVPASARYSSEEMQDLDARGWLDSVTSALGSAANTVQNVATGANNVYNSASGAITSATNAYRHAAPILSAILKREEEMEDHLYRRDNLEFGEELHRRDKMESERQLHRRDLVESAKAENEGDALVTTAPTSRKSNRRTRFRHRHRD